MSFDGLPALGGRAARVGLDLGSAATKVVLPPGPGETGPPRPLVVPSRIAYARPGALPCPFSCVGTRALERRDHLDLRHPFACADDEDLGSTLRDFGRHLRGSYQRRKDELPWGVVACPASATQAARDLRRVVGGEIFDRIALVDDVFLAAVAIDSREVSQHSVLIDFGDESVRAAIFHGSAPEAGERVSVAFDGAAWNDAFRDRLRLRYPELHFTDPTLTSLRESLAFLSPAARRTSLELRYQGGVMAVDVTRTIAEASAVALRPVLRAARDALALCPSDETEVFQENIVLYGGGAALPGLRARLEEELLNEGYDFARVRTVGNPRTLVAEGAYRWASRLDDADWSIPLFSFASD